MTKDINSTDHDACNELVNIVKYHGVNRVVISPGSRNAPLIVAFSRCSAIKKYVVVDERSAAFMALGMAQQTGEPIALICTSGSAMLNYAPAIAEAFYQNIPLIVITADRPEEWVDQNEGQIIRQVGALRNFVKGNYNISACMPDDRSKWYINRQLNDAMLSATDLPKGPVHINFQLIEPLFGEKPIDKVSQTRIIRSIKSDESLSNQDVKMLIKEMSSTKRIMILAGFYEPNKELESAINKLSGLPNITVLTETITNIHGDGIIHAIDRTLSSIDRSEDGDFQPELLITFGGALVSRMIKEFLRKSKLQKHWHIGVTESIIDTMMQLSERIEISPNIFFNQIASNLNYDNMIDTDYRDRWRQKYKLALDSHNEYINNSQWCDLKAFSILIPNIPIEYYLQVSNGTPIRYCQLFAPINVKQNNCNRGVAGIDGATSTALGASLAVNGKTLFISGDMSLTYDINGLNSQYNHPGFKVIVMCNGGGGIFRFIMGDNPLPEIDDYFEVRRDVQIKKYADAFGFDYFSADSEESLMLELPKFFADNNRAAIMAIFTPSIRNGEILREYFRRHRKNKIK